MIGKTTGVALVCVVVACLATSAYGKSVNAVIFDEAAGNFPADINLEDNDKTYVMDIDQDGTMSVGDILRGMFEVQSIGDLIVPGNTSIGAGSVNNELTAVFDIKVTAALAPGAMGNPYPGQWYWTFGPDAAFGTYPGDVGFIPPPPPPGAMIMMFDDSAQDYTDDAVVPGQEESLISTAGAGNATAAVWGAFGLSRPGDIWFTIAPTNSIAAVSAAPAPGQGSLPAASGAFVTSLIPTGGLADAILVPTGSGSELTGSMGIYGKALLGGGSASVNFDFISDSDLAIRVVPSPMAVWAAMPLIGLGAFMLKRRVLG